MYYLCIKIDGHWALFIIDRSMHKGYICDSYNKDQKKTPDDFLVVKVLNEALQVNLDWTFPKCNQQRETWECGYYVMKWMCDFFMVIQQGFLDNIPTHFVSRKPIPMSLLDKMEVTLGKEAGSVSKNTTFCANIQFCDECTKCEGEHYSKIFCELGYKCMMLKQMR
ncbi:hypothetical protein CTI12_AA168550 [Artemisia annua]|uniref:Uncharacterized protein n=1 Tax=Artemisia annua TaxID=35608 RepID=A0A2U1PC49_ARTAN|nr:hypothetical protein CTI12_AA168550 [Artemisia annua]